MCPTVHAITKLLFLRLPPETVVHGHICAYIMVLVGLRCSVLAMGIALYKLSSVGPSYSTAATALYVAYQSNLRMAVYATAVTGVGKRRVFSVCSCFPSGSLFFCEAQDPFFTCFELPLKRTAPSAAVSWCVLSTVGITIQGFQVTLANILIPQLGAVNISFSRGELAVEDVFWYAPVLHPSHVPEPTQYAFS